MATIQKEKRVMFTGFNQKDGKYLSPFIIEYKYRGATGWLAKVLSLSTGRCNWMALADVEQFARVKINWRKIPTR